MSHPYYGLNELREILESNQENAIALLDDMKINLQEKFHLQKKKYIFLEIMLH